MTAEKKELLSKINALIRKRKEELLDKLQTIRGIDDNTMIDSLNLHIKISLDSNTFKSSLFDNIRVAIANK